MKVKNLEIALSSIQREFPNPNVTLEQYPTSPELAANVIGIAINKYNDLGPNLIGLDLGCGTGMLTIAMAFVTGFVFAIDCDYDNAISIAEQNALNVELDDTIQFIQAKVQMTLPPKNVDRGSGSCGGGRGGRGRGRGGRGKGRGGGRSRGGRGGKRKQNNMQQQQQSSSSTTTATIINNNDGIPLMDKCVDTVITNPPFGTKPNNEGIDIQFLKTATRLAKKAVYSFHKRSTRKYILKTINDTWNLSGDVIAEMTFDIPQMYKFHKQKNVDIDVDLIRIDMTATTTTTSTTATTTTTTETTLNPLVQSISLQQQHENDDDDDDDDNDI